MSKYEIVFRSAQTNVEVCCEKFEMVRISVMLTRGAAMKHAHSCSIECTTGFTSNYLGACLLYTSPSPRD